MSIWQEESQSRMIYHGKILPKHTLACVAMATVILGEALKREFALLRTAVLNFSFQGKRVSFYRPVFKQKHTRMSMELNAK